MNITLGRLFGISESLLHPIISSGVLQQAPIDNQKQKMVKQ